MSARRFLLLLTCSLGLSLFGARASCDRVTRLVSLARALTLDRPLDLTLSLFVPSVPLFDLGNDSCHSPSGLCFLDALPGRHTCRLFRLEVRKSVDFCMARPRTVEYSSL